MEKETGWLRILYSILSFSYFAVIRMAPYENPRNSLQNQTWSHGAPIFSTDEALAMGATVSADLATDLIVHRS